MSAERPTVDIVIVSYNVADYLHQALLAAEAAAVHYGRALVTIWVVDNASADDSVARVRTAFPSVRLIANTENVGFARANNQAIALGQGDYILLLNPDTVMADDALARLVTYAEAHPQLGAVGPRLIDGQGRFLPESKRALPTPWVAFYKLSGLSAAFPEHPTFGQYHTRHLADDAAQQVEVLSGSCQLIRRVAYGQVGGLDNRYFMFGEDVDLSYRLLQAGWQNAYLPTAVVLHYKGRSSRRHSLGHVWRFYAAMYAFVRQHYQGRVSPVWYGLIWLGITLRGLLAAAARAGLRGAELLLFVALSYGIQQGWQRLVTYRDGGSYPATFAWFVAPGYAVVFVLALTLAGAYRRPYAVRPVGWGVLGGFAAIAVVSYLVPAINFSRAIVLGLTAAVGLSSLATRGLVGRTWRALRRLGAGEPLRAALVAADDTALADLSALTPRWALALDVAATYRGAELDTLVPRLALLRPRLVIADARGLDPSLLLQWRGQLAELGIELYTYSGGAAAIGPERVLPLR